MLISTRQQFCGLGIFPYRYLAVLKISRKSGADSCSATLVSFADRRWKIFEDSRFGGRLSGDDSPIRLRAKRWLASVTKWSINDWHRSQTWIGRLSTLVIKQKADRGECRNSVNRFPFTCLSGFKNNKTTLVIPQGWYGGLASITNTWKHGSWLL